ncbi:hypothetical protein CFOL_v3_00085, partial [Cephalotus follicularis]
TQNPIRSLLCYSLASQHLFSKAQALFLQFQALFLSLLLQHRHFTLFVQSIEDLRISRSPFEDSFRPISLTLSLSTFEHGAVIHYKPEPGSCSALMKLWLEKKNMALLILFDFPVQQMLIRLGEMIP